MSLPLMLPAMTRRCLIATRQRAIKTRRNLIGIKQAATATGTARLRINTLLISTLQPVVILPFTNSRG